MASQKSGTNSGGRRAGTFTGKDDPRNGRGPKPGAPNAGRPRSAFRLAMAQALEQGRAGEVVQHIISGDIRETLGVTPGGQPIVGETRNADRLAAIKLASSYAEGLPPQSMELTGAGGGPLEIRITRRIVRPK